MRTFVSTSTFRRVLIVVFIVIASQVARLVWQSREWRLEAAEMRAASQRAYVIRDRLSEFKEVNHQYPATLEQLGMPNADIFGFKYSTNGGGYSLGYFGAHYTTAVRKWSGD
jgi:hypothetical protein